MMLFKKKTTSLPRRRQNVDATLLAVESEIFRRNRTLTGTTSLLLNSVDAKSDLESSRTHAHRLETKRRKVFGVLMVVLLSSIALFLLIINFTASVKISVSDTSISKSIDAKLYEDAIQDYLGTNPMSRLRFLLNSSSLSSYISNNLPEVYSVVQQNDFGIGTTHFLIKLRIPVAGWLIDSKQYYVDSDGVAFERNYYSDPTVQIVDESGASIKSTGSTSVAAVFSQRFLSYVGKVVSVAKTSGYTVTSAVLPANTTRELMIQVKEVGYPIKLSIDRLVGEQIEDMSRAVEYFTSRGLTPAYIDVRVSGKAFYK